MVIRHIIQFFLVLLIIILYVFLFSLYSAFVTFLSLLCFNNIVVCIFLRFSLPFLHVSLPFFGVAVIVGRDGGSGDSDGGTFLFSSLSTWLHTDPLPTASCLRALFAFRSHCVGRLCNPRSTQNETKNIII